MPFFTRFIYLKTAVPGAWKYLNYKNSDAWTCGAIAYEIFGNPNPFYGENHLDGRTYTDNDLPTVNHANPIVQKLIKGLLKRNPDQVCVQVIYVYIYLYTSSNSAT